MTIATTDLSKNRFLLKLLSSPQCVNRFCHHRIVYNLIIAAVVVVVVSSSGCEAVDVKWTPATSGGEKGTKTNKETAATAPRSQRYWDEHGIERPDYAKTDLELLRDRSAGSSLSVVAWTFLLSLVVFVVVVMFRSLRHRWSGNRLGSGEADGSGRMFMSRGRFAGHFPSPSADETRAARLARFERSISTTDINNNISEDLATDTTNTKGFFLGMKKRKGIVVVDVSCVT